MLEVLLARIASGGATRVELLEDLRLSAKSSLTASITSWQSRAASRLTCRRGCAPGSPAPARPASSCFFATRSRFLPIVPSARSTNSGFDVHQLDLEAARSRTPARCRCPWCRRRPRRPSSPRPTGPLAGTRSSVAALIRPAPPPAPPRCRRPGTASRGRSSCRAAPARGAASPARARPRRRSGGPSATAPPFTLTRLPVPAQRLAVGQRLRGERLVRLDQVEVPDRRRPSSSSASATASIGAKNRSFGSPPPVA